MFCDWNYNAYYYVWILYVEHIRMDRNDNIIFVFTSFYWSVHYNYSAISTKRLKPGERVASLPGLLG